MLQLTWQQQYKVRLVDLMGYYNQVSYRNILQFKVATQFGKTVLSPATQVRNVTSASMFPLANGHIGGRASVTESIKNDM